MNDSQSQLTDLPAGLAYLNQPWLVLVGFFLLAGIAVNYFADFRFDASSDTLVVEGDPDLLEYEQVVETFGGDAFLVLTFAPHDQQPISAPALKTLSAITEELREIAGVRSVFSVLDAPLLKSPPVEITDLLDGFPTLTSPQTDLVLAEAELTQSPFFRELLITGDGTATAIKIDLLDNPELITAQAEFDRLQAESQDTANVQAASERLLVVKDAAQATRAQLLQAVRRVQTKYQDQVTLYLGGVPMIAADMITYVKSDLAIFGGAVIVLMIVTLSLFFRRPRWVVLPILTAAGSVALTVGLLGFLGWQATVISSNFVSLLGITTISLTIHLIVQYRELIYTQSDWTHKQLVFATMRSKFIPCFYTALTTIAAFGSLTVSGILPVEYFGWMMCIGILVSFFATYTIFPSVLLLLPRGTPSSNLGKTNNFIRGLGEIARWHPWVYTGGCLLLLVLAVVGINRVSLDNRFAEYFDDDTEIFQGMRYIDQNLGGTIPFDVVLSYAPYEDEGGFGDEDDFFSDDAEEYPERYWYTRSMLDRLETVHRYVDAQPQVGKVLSLTALEDFAMEFTDGKKLGSVEIVAILGALPDSLHSQIIAPYASPATGELRLAGRIIESGPGFDREQFSQDIKQFANAEANFQQDEVVVTGMMVLFNGMLSKLLDSQISTLTYILAVIFIMFLILLRSLRDALLGMIPNTLASATAIGAMGFTGVPLDMMTTTIAAVCIGIGVDDTIHYLHRFREEYARHGDARVAVSFCHESIGRALYYTSITVVAGFSVLSFSSFVPTVMFGVWTAIAMVLALLANLTLLPALLVLTHASKPIEPELRTPSATE